MENLDPYAVLGVTKDASLKDIKRAFRRLAMKWHPDRCAGLPELERLQAELIFKQINLANEVLSNEAKRRRYDAGSASLSELCAGFWENLVTKMQGKAKAPPLGGDGNVKGVVRVVPGAASHCRSLRRRRRRRTPPLRTCYSLRCRRSARKRRQLRRSSTPMATRASRGSNMTPGVGRWRRVRLIYISYGHNASVRY